MLSIKKETQNYVCESVSRSALQSPNREGYVLKAMAHLKIKAT